MRTLPTGRMRFLPAALLLLALAAGPARAAGVHVALVPAHVTVEPDSTFVFTLDVTAAGGAFNSVKATIGF